MPLYTFDDGATYNEGDTFYGDLLNGVRHGQGTYTWANGDTYVGPFDQSGYMNCTDVFRRWVEVYSGD